MIFDFGLTFLSTKTDVVRNGKGFLLSRNGNTGKDNLSDNYLAVRSCTNLPLE